MRRPSVSPRQARDRVFWNRGFMGGELLSNHWHTVPQIEGGPGKPDPRHWGLEVWVKDLCDVLDSKGMELAHKLCK